MGSITEEGSLKSTLFLEKGKKGYNIPDPRSVEVYFQILFNTYDSDVKESPIYENLIDRLIPNLPDNFEGMEALDVAFGTGVSGKPLVDLGMVVDGVDLTLEGKKKALKRGYRDVWKADLLNGSINSGKKYPLVLSIGVMGDYVPSEIVIPKMIEVSTGDSMLAFTSLKPMTNKKNLKKTLRDNGFEIKVLDVDTGYCGKNVLEENYFFVVAKREDYK